MANNVYVIPESSMPHLRCTIDGKTVDVAYNEILECPYSGLKYTVSVINYNSAYMYSPSGTLSGTIATSDGEYYEIYVSLKDSSTTVYQWADGSTEDLVLRWKINRTLFPKPTAPVLEFDYEGNGAAYNKAPAVLNYNSNVMTRDGTYQAYKANNYTISYRLKDTDSSAWIDENSSNGESTDDVIINWKINKIAVPIPYFTPIEGNPTPEIFTYDGKYHAPNITGYNSKVMSRSGNISNYANVNKYNITYSLFDTTSCYWDDDEKSIAPKILHWEIQKAIIRYPKPSLNSSNLPFKYDGLSHAPTMVNFASNVMTRTGTLSSIAACKIGEDNNYIPWVITVSFVNNSSYTYKWDDDPSTENVNSTEQVVLPWIVEKTEIKEPCFENDISEFPYAGKTITPVVKNYNSNVMSRSGTTSATNCNDYEISYTLKDPESAYWENHPEDSTIVLKWKIIDTVVPFPIIGNTTLPVSWNAGYTNSQAPSVTYDSNLVSLTNYNRKSAVGEYEFTISLKNPQHSVWEDTKTNESRTIKWEIVPQKETAAKPTISGQTEFSYDGKTHTISINGYPVSSRYYWVHYTDSGTHYNVYYQKLTMSDDSVTSAIKAGDYIITIIPYMNGVSQTYWNDDTTMPITFHWEITKNTFPKPTIDETILLFNGYTQSVAENNYDSYVMTRTGTISAKTVGDYEIKYTLKDKESSTWDDGSVEDVVIKWSIISIAEDKPLTPPKVSPLSFGYDGTRHTVTIEPYDTALIKVTGISYATNAGTYKLTFSLIYPDSTAWDDGTVANKTVEWVINKKIEKLPKPYLTQNEHVYDAIDYTPVVTNFVSGKMAKNGDVTQRKASDNYEIVVELLTTTNYTYIWDDESTDNITLKWKITPITIPAPQIEETVFYYGAYVSSSNYISYAWRQPLIKGYAQISKYVTSEGVVNKKALITNEYRNGTQYITDGNYYGTNQWRLGKYYIKIEPTDPESCTWEDSHTADKIEVEWSIVREIRLIPKPELLEGNFHYDGTEKKPVISNVDEGVILSNDTEAIAAGNYTVTVSLDRYRTDKDIYDYRWEDNTLDPISFNWNISDNVSLKVPTLEIYSYPYDGLPHKPAIIGLKDNVINVISYNEKTAAGDYEITFSLIDPTSSTWEDGDTNNKTVTWAITKTKFKKPTISPEYVTYDGETHTVEFVEQEGDHSFIVENFNSNTMVTSGTIKATIVGDYIAVVQLKDTNSATWDDDTTTPIELPWKIIKKIVKLDKPYLETDTFSYDGSRKTPKVLSPTKTYLDTGISLNGDTYATNVGNYNIAATLMETHDITYLWGDLSTDPVELPWKITPIAIPMPKVSPLEFEYDGNTKRPTITDYDSNYVTILNSTTSATNQGTYFIVFSLKNKTSTSWVGGSTTDIKYTWIIKRKASTVSISDIRLDQTEFIFDTVAHRPNIVNFNSTEMTYSNYTSQTNYGEYTIIVTPKDNYSWADGSTDPVELKWKINKKVLNKPDISPKTFEYDGTAKTPMPNNYDSTYMSYNGDKSKTAAGEYNVNFVLKYKHSCVWVDDSTDPDDNSGNIVIEDLTEDIHISWKITSAKVKVPYIEDILFIYDGNNHSPTIINYDSKIMNINGTQTSVIPGEYKITFVLKDSNSAAWEDGVEGSRVYDWKIIKKQLIKPYLENTEFIYNSGEHRISLKEFDVNMMNKSGTETATNAGNYSITVSLRYPQYYEWLDGSTTSVILDWKIKNRSVEKPKLEPMVFIYDGKSHRPELLGFRSVAMNRTGYDYKTAIGIYTITVTLNQNYEWTDGSTESLILIWTIIKDPVPIPEVENLEFTYDGFVHAPNISAYNFENVRQIGVSSATNAGTYKIIFSLTDKDHNAWTNGSSEDIVISWVIYKIKLPLEVTDTEFVYNGGIHLPTIFGFDSSKMTYTNGSITQAIDAGIYNFSISLKDKINYSWEDDTTTNKNFTWTIDRKIIDIPYLVTNTFIYNGQTRTPEVRGFNSELMYYPNSATNKRSAVNVGTYNVIIALGIYQNGNHINKNYKWADGSTGSLYLTWTITSQLLKYPELVNDKYEYNGIYQSPETRGYNTKYMKAIENVYEKDRGVYQVGFILTDNKNYAWENGVVDGMLIPWEIIRAKLNKSDYIPVQNPILVYNGKEQTPTWDNYDTSKLIFKDTKSATNAGTYIAHFSPTDNYTWEDGTTDDITVEWVIEKLGLEMPKQYNVLYYNGKEQEPIWLVMYHS